MSSRAAHVRKLSIKLSNAANLTHCGKLTTTSSDEEPCIRHMMVLAQGVEP